MKREKADVMKNMQYVLNMRPVLNKDALFSDGSEYYRCPSEPMPGDTVKIRFRTQRNNVDAVYLVYGDVRQKIYSDIILKLYMDGLHVITPIKEYQSTRKNGQSLKYTQVIIRLHGLKVQ